MFAKLKLYIVLGALTLIIGTIVYFFKTHAFVEKSILSEKDTLIAKSNREVLMLKNQVFSIQQDLDICNGNKPNYEMVIDKLTKERNEARAEAKTLREAIEHYETNDLIRYFVFDKKGIFKKGCYEEVFQKPDNICK